MLLAWLPEDELAAFLRRPLTALTPATITDPRALRAELQNLRERGYGTEVEDFEPGLHACTPPHVTHAKSRSRSSPCPAPPTASRARASTTSAHCCSKPRRRWRPRSPDATSGPGVIREISAAEQAFDDGW